MIEHNAAPVKVQGEPLDEILWRGRQWAVTRRGIECLDGTYFIGRDRLAEEIEVWSWIRQIGEKGWADVPDFTTAFLVAVVLHGHAPGFDPKTLLDQYQEACRDNEEERA